MVNFFTDKTRKLREKLPVKNGDPLEILKNALSRWGHLKNVREKFKLKMVSEAETIASIKSLKSGTAFGHDLLDSESIKLAEKHLFRPLNFLTNLSIKNNKFANRWKIARVVPLYKGGGGGGG